MGAAFKRLAKTHHWLGKARQLLFLVRDGGAGECRGVRFEVIPVVDAGALSIRLASILGIGETSPKQQSWLLGIWWVFGYQDGFHELNMSLGRTEVEDRAEDAGRFPSPMSSA
jgi:hypothetical protein